MLMGFFFVILIVCLAMMMSEGLWSNAISAINVTLAAMVATNWYEILADYLNSQAPSYTYVWDFLMLWALFALSFTVFRAFTDQISKHRVRFKMPVEIAGRIIFALLTGWIFICFTNMTLHTAPLARTAFRGSFSAEPKSKSFLGLAPDRLWLGFMQSRSRGILFRIRRNQIIRSGRSG